MTSHKHAELPLADYDSLSVPTLSQRIRSLTPDQLGQLLDHERTHAARPAVLELMAARLGELDAGATPSPGANSGPGPGRPGAGQPASARSAEAAKPATTGPPAFPPPHGLPAQPGRPKANRQKP